ncbi:MAG TPA: nicotinate-nucleotide diphosphorylase (carboxylating), partial [Bdellovibrionota bacterium]|nr:nicotinate-nucleotide diphosphorylase (carboxylating) [Bdellovibrionota bacterium]
LVAQVEKAARAAGCAAPRVAPTRKTLPHYRDLALFAVRAGGGHPHRVNLAGGVLIKENHVAAAGGMARAVEGARRTAPHGLKIEAEVRNRQELDEALAAGADGVLLDNFAPKQAIEAARAAKKKNSRVLVEISGGVSEETAGSYVDAAVDVISSGSLTHSPKALDISMLLELGK